MPQALQGLEHYIGLLLPHTDRVGGWRQHMASSMNQQQTSSTAAKRQATHTESVVVTTDLKQGMPNDKPRRRGRAGQLAPCLGCPPINSAGRVAKQK